nr:hypothetical protein CFP56_56422 [Quercus suber]
MHQNCFSSEVCNHFQCGFPYNWEEYAVGFCGDKHRVSASNEFNMSSGDSANKTLPFSFDDLPGNSPMKNVDSGSDETPVNQMETKVDYKFNNDNTILNSRDMTKEEHQKASCHSEMGTNVLTPTRVACKRSPSRLKNSGMKDEVVSSNSHGKSTYSDRAISSDATRNGIGGRVTKSASNPTNSFGEDNVTLVTADNPKVRQRRRKSLRKYCKLLILLSFHQTSVVGLQRLGGHEIHFTSSPSAFKSSKKETPTHIVKTYAPREE